VYPRSSAANLFLLFLCDLAVNGATAFLLPRPDKSAKPPEHAADMPLTGILPVVGRIGACIIC
jgi:hypothetical protein